MNNAPQRKSVKKWVILLILPFLLLITLILIQMITRFVVSSLSGGTEIGLEPQDPSVIVQLVKMLGFIVIAASVVLFVLSPVWIVLLIRDLIRNRKS